MDRDFNVSKFIEECGEYTDAEFIFFANVILRSGEIYNAEITHNTEYINNKKTGSSYFAALIDQPQEIEKEIKLGSYLKCRKISYNGVIKWIVIE